MAFTTTFTGTTSGVRTDVFNVDFSVGFGGRGNRQDDVMLVQALFRILHFELSEDGGEGFPPPSGVERIAVDGLMGPITSKCINNLQRELKNQGVPILLDGILDPFRKQEQLSTRARVRYALEGLNATVFANCKDAGLRNYIDLPRRDDLPKALTGALQQRRTVARQYQGSQSPA